VIANQNCVRANKVKIQAATKWPIQVFEVFVVSEGSNVAVGKSATQGSTHNNKPWMSASKAIDGNNSTFSHTAMMAAIGSRLIFWDHTRLTRSPS
jgi:hypothetical protein